MDCTPPQQRRYLRKEDRRVVGEATVDQGAGVVADEEGVEPHVRAQPVVVVGRDAERPHLEDLGVENRLRIVADILGEGSHQVLRLGAGGADKDPVSGADVGEDLLFGDKLVGILSAEALERLHARR